MNFSGPGYGDKAADLELEAMGISAGTHSDAHALVTPGKRAPSIVRGPGWLTSIKSEIDTGLPPWLMWVLGGAGVLALAGGGLSLYKRRSKGAVEPKSNPHKRKHRKGKRRNPCAPCASWGR